MGEDGAIILPQGHTFVKDLDRGGLVSLDTKMKVKTGKYGVELPYVHNSVVSAINEIPYVMTITDALRSEEMNKGREESVENSLHRLGKAVDFSIKDKAGESFQVWLKTTAGKEWKKKYKADVVYHGKEDNRHIHVEFNI